MKKLILIYLLAFLLNSISFADTTTQELPPGFQITKASSKGKPCSIESTPITLSSDLFDLSITMDGFMSRIGAPGAYISKPLTHLTQVCTLDLNLQTPDGWRFGIKSPHLKGYLFLPERSWSYARTQLQIGSHKTLLSDLIMTGPYEGALSFDPNLGLKSDGSSRMYWSSCKHPKNELVRFSLQTGIEFYKKKMPKLDPKYAEFDIDSFELAFSSPDNVVWQKCTTP